MLASPYVPADAPVKPVKLAPLPSVRRRVPVDVGRVTVALPE